MIWFTSDLHFGHEAVIRLNKRPFANLQEMHNELIVRWNKCVQPNDTVYVLGDMAMGPFRDFEPLGRQLNGNKYLIRGNHDGYSEGQYNKIGFTVYHELKMKLAGNYIRLSHYPHAYSWWRKLFAYKTELRYLDRRPPKVANEFLLHGHVHMKYKRVENRIHVGVDAWDYYPVSQRQIESLMGKGLV